MALPRSRALLGLGALLAPAAARGQDRWPSQPIKLVVPYPPGALTDTLGRMVGERLNVAFGQPVIVDNKAGAATHLGASYVAEQPADGYTLLLATVTALCITPALYAKPLIAHTDFAGAAMLGNVTLILVCCPDLPVADPQALVALLRSKPGRYSYGQDQGARRHRRQPPGRVTRRAGLAGVLPRPRPPTLDVAPPAGTPASILGRLNGEINVALQDSAFMQRLRQVGVEPMPLTVTAFGDFIRYDAGRWAELVKKSGAKAE